MIENIDKIDRLPLNIRNRFQVKVFQILISEKMLDEKDTDRIQKISEMISDFIDNTDNAEERQLILDGNFDKAARILIVEIKRRESLQSAA